MSKIELEFHVRAPVEAVWEFGLQAEKIPRWQYDVVEVKGIAGPIDRAGKTYTLVYKKAGRLLESPVEVSRFEPENRIIETTGLTPLGGYFRSKTAMEAAGAGATHVKWEMDYRLPGWFMGVLLDKLLFKRAFKRTVEKYNENFKDAIEKEFISGRRPGTS